MFDSTIGKRHMKYADGTFDSTIGKKTKENKVYKRLKFLLNFLWN